MSGTAHIRTPYISVIITGMNASSTIQECLKSISKLRYPRNRFEVIYVDGDSTDQTVEIVKSLSNDFSRLLIVVERGSPGRGRNRGITEARGEIIAFTDADCTVDKLWLNNIVKHLTKADDGVVGVGGPSLTPHSDTYFAKCVGWLFSTPFGAVNARNPAIYKGVRDVDHNPTCNTAFRREAFEEVGLFREDLPVTEDLEFDLRVRRRGHRLLYAEDIVVWHHRRRSLKGFIKQMYKYGFWRAQIGKEHRDLIRLIHFVPSLFLAYIIVLPLVFQLSPSLSILLLSAYLIFGLASGIAASFMSRDLKLTVIITFLGFVEHLSYGAGLFAGLVRSNKHAKTSINRRY